MKPLFFSALLNFLQLFRALLNFLQLFFRTKVSTQAPLKFFLWLQKHCSKHLGASTTPGLYNAHRIKDIGCLEKKERNENDARLNSKDFKVFRIFRAFLNFLQLFFRTKVSTQAPLKYSMAPKTLFKASRGFYNTRALQRTSNQGHRMLRKKRTQRKRRPSKL